MAEEDSKTPLDAVLQALLQNLERHSVALQYFHQPHPRSLERAGEKLLVLRVPHPQYCPWSDTCSSWLVLLYGHARVFRSIARRMNAASWIMPVVLTHPEHLGLRQKRYRQYILGNQSLLSAFHRICLWLSRQGRVQLLDDLQCLKSTMVLIVCRKSIVRFQGSEERSQPGWSYLGNRESGNWAEAQWVWHSLGWPQVLP